MKNLYSVIYPLVAIMILAGPANMAAQSEFTPATVEISRNKVRIGDDYFYEHQVKAHQTLFSICKVYGVDEATLKKYNPGKLDDGLKTGSLLIIPVKSDSTSEKETSQKKSIISIKRAAAQATDSNSDEPQYISHRVRWYDSLTTIALKYKVSQEEIIRINKLGSGPLTVNQILKIPTGTSAASSCDSDTEQVAAVSEITSLEEDVMTEDIDECTDTVSYETDDQLTARDLFTPFSGSASIALLLPINAKGNPSSSFLNFYAGVMIGLNELKEDGISVKLHVIDLADYNDIDSMLAENPLEEYDFVIGNFTADNVDDVAYYCDERCIPLISPLDQKIEQNTYSHPYLVSVPVSGETQIRNTIQQIDFKASADNVIVIYESGGEKGAYCSTLCNMLDSLDVPFKKLHYDITGGRDIQGTIQNALVASKENHLFIASEKESFATDALRNLAIIGRSESFNMTGYASHKMRNIESIEPSSFNDAHMHFCLGYYVDYSDEPTRQFVRRYRAFYNCEPDPFAFQGHDIVVYFTHALKEYGSRMIDGLEDYPMNLLQLKFKFGRRGEQSGLFNEATKDIAYGENLSIEVL